jgi:hypothetical protein
MDMEQLLFASQNIEQLVRRLVFPWRLHVHATSESCLEKTLSSVNGASQFVKLHLNI